MSVFPVTRLHYVATDGCSLLLREAIDNMDAETFKLYLKYHLLFANEMICWVSQATLLIYSKVIRCKYLAVVIKLQNVE